MKSALCSKIILSLRTSFFLLSMSLFTIVYSFICVAAFPLPFRCRYFLITSWTAIIIWLAKVCCGIRYQVEGLENIPKGRTAIVLSKHQSTWETFFLPKFFNPSAIIVKRELLWVPFFGWGLATINPIAIDRSKKSSAMEQIIKKGTRALAENRWIIMYPEGTRIPVGKVGTYRAGGVRLAIASQYPIIPVAHNAGLYWPKNSWIKKPGTVRVIIGPPIDPVDKTPEELIQKVKEWIETTIARMDQA